ncbi:MAG: MarR family transcriptional regulator [Deltaproteobacteria bacterium]|nr:MarR family transcriptional regulator [Deltaproteobacteria bacterium]
MTAPNPDSWSSTMEAVASTFARAAGVYGQSPLLGRLLAVLFFSPDPMTLGELCEAVGAAKSTVSVAMRKLESGKLVRRSWKKGDRRDYYEAVGDPHQLLHDWMSTFLAAEMSAWIEASTLAKAALDAAPSDGPDAAGRAEIQTRIEAFNAFGEIVATTFQQVLASHHVHAGLPLETDS